MTTCAAVEIRLRTRFHGLRKNSDWDFVLKGRGNINAALAAEGALSAREILFRQPVQARRKRYAILAVSRIAEKLELRIGLSL
jgi:hypothetical protein